MENLYRWVKASERLPSKPGLVHYKEEGGLNDVVFYDDKHGFYKPKVFRSKGMSRKSETVIGTINTPPYKIFWLEQVEPLPSDKMEWVDVKTRLPENEDEVLVVHTEAGGISQAWYFSEEQRWVSCDSDIERNGQILVTHWQPLPHPPVK